MSVLGGDFSIYFIEKDTWEKPTKNHKIGENLQNNKFEQNQFRFYFFFFLCNLKTDNRREFQIFIKYLL